MPVSIQAAVEGLVQARSSARLVAPLSDTHGDLTVGHAYAIQDALRIELERRGERRSAGSSAPPARPARP